MSDTNIKQQTESFGNNLDFDIKNEIIAARVELNKGKFKRILIVVGILILTVFASELLHIIRGDETLFSSDPAAAFGFLMVPVFFGGYLYIMEMIGVSLGTGSQVFTQYAQLLASKDTSINRFKDCSLETLILQLASLEGLNYAQLDKNQKEMVIYSVANGLYKSHWLFSKTTLDKIKTADSNEVFYQTIANTDDVISGKEAYVRKYIQERKKSK